jgi:microcystin-dependent protein
MARAVIRQRAFSFVRRGRANSVFDLAQSICRIFIKFDSSGKPLRSAPNTELLAGTIIQGTPYVAVYNNADGAFYLRGFFGSPYNIPLGAGLDYWGPTTPNSSFAFPTGQAISRTTYASLFALIGTTYGTGDGSTTFNLPDKTGRVSAMKEASATRLTSGGFGGNSANLGAIGGGDKQSVGQANFPNVNFAVTGSASVTTDQGNVAFGNITTIGAGGGVPLRCFDNTGGDGPISSHGTISGSAASGGSGTPLPTCQPTIICNYIIRIF